MIRFLGNQFPVGDLHSSPRPNPSGLVATRTTFWGTVGTSEIVNQQGPFTVEAEAWINDTGQNSPGQLVTWRHWMEDRVGLNGKLEFVATQYSRTYYRSTLESVTEVPLAGQDAPTPVQAADGRWVLAVRLVWAVLWPDNGRIPVS